MTPASCLAQPVYSWGELSVYLYEMIQVSGEWKRRARTWQWFRDDTCRQRTLIDEVFVTRAWRSFTDTSAPNLSWRGQVGARGRAPGGPSSSASAAPAFSGMGPITLDERRPRSPAGALPGVRKRALSKAMVRIEYRHRPVHPIGAARVIRKKCPKDLAIRGSGSDAGN